MLDRILVDKLNTKAVQQAMKRDFLLELSVGFLYDCLAYAISKVAVHSMRSRERHQANA